MYKCICKTNHKLPLRISLDILSSRGVVWYCHKCNFSLTSDEIDKDKIPSEIVDFMEEISTPANRTVEHGVISKANPYLSSILKFIPENIVKNFK